MVGEKLREARHNQQLSLTQVAARARISAATLSRIENEKQALDVEMLCNLSKILGVMPEDMIGDHERGDHPEAHLAEQIGALRQTDRTQLWRDLAANRRSARARRAESRELGPRIEELLAQVDFLRQEIESVRTRLKRSGRV